MNFETKTYLTLTKKAGGILGAEMYATEQGLKSYGNVVNDQNYYLAKADKENWSICSHCIKDYIPLGTSIMEYGPGNRETIKKTKRMVKSLRSKTYTGVDISPSAINQALESMASINGIIEANGVITNFWDDNFPIMPRSTLALFAGGSIGNLDLPVMEAPPTPILTQALKKIAQRTNNGWLLVSADALVANESYEKYTNAYSSKAHSTFNLGIFSRMQNELGCNISPKDFMYKVEFHKASGAILHNAYAKRSFSVSLNNKIIKIKDGDKIHLQNCFRFTDNDFVYAANRANLNLKNIWKHPHSTMRLYLFKQEITMQEEDMNSYIFKNNNNQKISLIA